MATYITKDLILLNTESKSKNNLLLELTTHLYKESRIDNIQTVFEQILEREKIGSTGFGGGLAIPHAKSSAVKEPTILFARSTGIPYESMDHEDVQLIFLIVTNEENPNLHLTLLSRVATILMDNQSKETLLHLSSKEGLFNLLKTLNE